MFLRKLICWLVVAAGCTPAFAQDAAGVVAAATRAMGLDGVSSLYYYGSGSSYALGQNNNANIPWPLTPLNEWTRAINFDTGSTRATWSTFATSAAGGAPVLRAVEQMASPTSPGGWNAQLELWTTPWGFLKGAASNGATVKTQTIAGKPFKVVSWNAPVKSPGGQAYRVVGFINAGNLVEKVQTWVENPVFGDMLVESDYSFYRENDGLKYPTEIVQQRGGWPVLKIQVLGAFKNPAKLAQLMAPNTTASAVAAPAAAAAPAAPAPASEQLAPGVYRIRGAYNSLAVEFADHVLLIEPGPQHEARALAGIAETKRLFPGKPIRFGVITHHHFDHTGGIAAVAAEGITIVTPEVNKAFLEKALSGPRTLAPDALAKSGRKPVIEGFKGDLRVFEDATRRVEVHVIKNLPHADGLVVAWLPKEKLLVYADMFNLQPADQPVANPPVIGTRIFLENITRLKLDPERILSIHSLIPDRLATLQDIRGTMGL